MCFLIIPDYVGASGGEAAFWHLLGGGLALLGVAGLLIEMSKVTELRGAGYVGASVIVAAPAGGLHLLQSNEVISGPVATASQYLAVAVLLFALTGLGMGSGRLVASVLSSSNRKDSDSASLTIRIISLITVLIGLLTAALNFLAR